MSRYIMGNAFNQYCNVNPFQTVIVDCPVDWTITVTVKELNLLVIIQTWMHCMSGLSQHNTKIRIFAVSDTQ